MNYTINKNKKQGANPLNYYRTHENCKPHFRCKQIHKCKTCKEIHNKKLLSKHLDHIKDRHLKKFKYRLYVTITPKDLCRDFEIHNINIDDFNKYLSNTGQRRYKKHPFHNSEYIIFKEITKTPQGLMLPHLHIILLTNEYPLFDNQLFDYDIRDIKMDLDRKYKNDYRNPFTQTLKKIFMYSVKSDSDRINFERNYNISNGKSNVKSSNLFKHREVKPHNLFAIHIQIVRNIKQHGRNARKMALLKHTEFKAKHKRAKDITIHKHALKIKKEIQNINKNQKDLLARADAKLKHAKRRNFRPPK